jgi:hypothetical protein
MLEAKTKGNLDKDEEKLLKQSLMTLRLAFVEAVEKEPDHPAPSASPEAGKAQAPMAGAPELSTPAEPEETHKKFSKKY